MNKLINILCLSFLCGIASAQIYTPASPTIHGHREDRLDVLQALHPPEKSVLELNTNLLRPQIFYYSVDSSFWGWSQQKGYFKLGSGVGGGGGVATVTFSENGDTSIVYLVVNGAISDSVVTSKTDMFEYGGTRLSDTTFTVGSTLKRGVNINTARLDTTTVSSDSTTLGFHFMSGATKNIHFIATESGSSAGADSLRLTPQSVPYASSTGALGEDVGGLFYDNTNLNVGHNNPSVYSGFNINGGRASIQAALNGMRLNVGSGFVIGTYDASKHITLMNRGNTYLDIYSVGTGPWVHHADFNTNVSISQSLNVGITGDYADNAAAIAAGLTVGTLYRTGDLLKIVH